MSRMLELALRTWPSDYRAAHGDELVDAAQALGQDRSTTREVISLALSGLRARFHAATGAQPNELWRRGLRLGLLGSAAAMVAQITMAVIEGPWGDLSRWDSGLILGLGIGVAMMLSLTLEAARVGAGATTLAALAFILWDPIQDRPGVAVAFGAQLAVLWLLARREPANDLGLLARMAGLVALGVTIGFALGNFWLIDGGVPVIATVMGLALVAWDPRLLAGMICFWIFQFTMMIGQNLIDDPSRFSVAPVLGPAIVMAIGAAVVTSTCRRLQVLR